MTRIKKLAVKTIQMLGGAVLIFNFVSCKNFLNSADIKKELEDTIAYNNAKSITLQLDSNNTGLLNPNGRITKKIGFDFEVTYKIDSQNYTINDISKLLLAVDYYNHEKIYDENTVSVTTEEQNEDDKLNGIYRIKVLVKKEVENLLIIPNSSLIPVVESFYPPYDNAGYPQDTSIQITFSSPVNISDFKDENGKLKNISISSDGKNLLDNSSGNLPYYLSPSLSSDGRILSIPFNSSKNLFADGDTVNTKPVSVVLYLQNLTDAKGNAFKNIDYTYNYRVNHTKDTNPPVIKKLQIARTKEDAQNGTNLISMENSYTDFSVNNEVCVAHIREHHVKDFWIYFELEDEGSGVQGLEITEQFKYANTGSERQGEILLKEIINEDLTSRSFSGVYHYTFNSLDDGLINLIFSAKDKAGNKSFAQNRKSVYLIKDTQCSETFSIYINQLVEVNDSNNVSLSFRIEYDGSGSFWSVKSPFAYCGEKVSPETTGAWTDDKIEILSISYGYDEQNLAFSMPTTFTSGSINVNPYKDLYIKVIFKDALGNISEITHVINAVQTIGSYKIEDGKLYLYGIDDSTQCNGYFVWKDSDGNILKESAIKTSGDKPYAIIQENHINNILYYIMTGKGQVPIEKIVWSDGTNTKISDMNTGTLSVYPITVMDSSLGVIGKDDLLVYKGKEFEIDLTKPNLVTFAEDYLNFEVEKLAPVINSGFTYFRIKGLQNNNQEVLDILSGYNCFIKYYKTGDESNARYKRILSFNDDFVFYAKNDICTYNFQILASFPAGYLLTLAQSVELTTEDDTISPVVGINTRIMDDEFCEWCEASTNRLVVKDFIRETGSGLPYEDYKGDIKRVPIKYCFDNIPKYGLINWDSDNVKTAWLYSNSPLIEFSREGADGNYFHALVNDVNGNYQEYTANFTVNYKEAFLCKETRGALNPGDIYIPNGHKKSAYFSAQYLKNDKWEYTSQMNSNYKIDNSSIVNETDRKLTLSYTPEEKTSFVRVILCEMAGSTGNENNVAKPIYYCPAYYTDPDSVNSKLKGYLNTDFGPLIYCEQDRPCFAHTFYCSKNLGDNKEDWLYNGIETGLRMETSSFTYENSNYDSIPAGKYYTTIIHYADGSMTMTDVKLK